MSRIRPHFMLALLTAMLLLTAFTMPATAQGNPTKTPKPTNTVRSSTTPKPSVTPKPSLTPRPSITPVGFVSIPTRAKDFGGGGTILYTTDSRNLWAMNATGENDRNILSGAGKTTQFTIGNPRFLGDPSTIIFQDTMNELNMTDLKGRTPEKLGISNLFGYIQSPDRKVLMLAQRSDDFEKLLVAYDVTTKQTRQLSKTVDSNGLVPSQYSFDGYNLYNSRLKREFVSIISTLTGY